jgi:hypothetical protein
VIPIDLADVRFRRAVARLHRLGSRVAAELLAELGARHLIREPIEAVVAAYLARLDPGYFAPSAPIGRRSCRSASSRAGPDDRGRYRSRARRGASVRSMVALPPPGAGSRGSTLALRDGDRALVAVCHAGCSRADTLAKLRRRSLLDGLARRASGAAP